MPRATRSSVPKNQTRAAQDAAKQRQQRKAHARTIVAHIEAAKARKSGADITDLLPDELIADLMRRRVSA